MLILLLLDYWLLVSASKGHSIYTYIIYNILKLLIILDVKVVNP